MRVTTAEQMRRIDRETADAYRLPTLLLMENAGSAVANRVLQRLSAVPGRPMSGTVDVLCGHGNNGGDGFVACRHLSARGAPVRCFLAGERSRVAGDSRVNLDALEAFGIEVHPFDSGWRPPPQGMVIDALLGTGFKGEPRDSAADAIRGILRSGVPVVSVDLPSGLDADTGRPSSLCVRATETVTLGLPKLGMVQEPGRSHLGELWVAPISIPRALREDARLTEWITAASARPLWPAPSSTAHKATHGRLFILAGSTGLTGAAALAATGALRSGVGLVTVGCPADLNPILEIKLTEAMTLPLPEAQSGTLGRAALEPILEALAKSTAAVIGPGLGRCPETASLLRDLFPRLRIPLVVDADGLNLMAPARAGEFPPGAVLTPHPGEMARLLGTDVEAVQSNRLDAAREAAALWDCVILLKGPGTVVAAPDGSTSVNSSGSPALATGGSGDVLSGIIGACLARGDSPYRAACIGAFVHGAAGEVAGERHGSPGALAGDVVACIPEALRRLRCGELAEPYGVV